MERRVGAGSRAYLVRLWRAGSDEAQRWRASTQSVDTGERRAFATLEDLFRFLHQETNTAPGQQRGQCSECRENR